MRYKQQTRLFNGNWDDLSNTDGQNRFDSAKAAQADLDEMFEYLRYAAARGYMKAGHDPADYRVVPVTGED